MPQDRDRAKERAAEPGYPSRILPFPSQLKSWSAEGIDGALAELIDATVRAAQSRIDWYNKKAGELAFFARWFRRIALICVSIAAVAPLVGALLESYSTLSDVPAAEIGYIILALAGGLIGSDKLFGTSDSWMRYRTTQAELVRRLVRFRHDWAAELAGLEDPSSIPPAERKKLVYLTRDFIDDVENAVEAETKI